MGRKILKVVVIDDSKMIRRVVTEMIAESPAFEVLGEAANGEEGLELVQDLQPDLVTLDIEMPVLGGISTIKRLMIQCPTSIVIFSSLFGDGRTAFEALRLGVMDFIPKPAQIRDSLEKARIQHQMIERLKVAAEANLDSVRRIQSETLEAASRFRVKSIDSSMRKSPSKALAIGTSVSGPNTFISLLSSLPPKSDLSVFVMQDLDVRILQSFAQEFSKYSAWNIEVLDDSTPIREQTCYLCTTRNPVKVVCSGADKFLKSAPMFRQSPLDLFFSSISEAFMERTVSVALAGSGMDGVSGFMTVFKNGGHTIVQDVRDNVFPSLPQKILDSGFSKTISVIDRLAEDAILALDAL